MYLTHTPMQHCPSNCEYRVSGEPRGMEFRIRMFCNKYRHPLYRDKCDYKNYLTAKTGRNIKPLWCTKETK